MTTQGKLERWREKLVAVRTEQSRQLRFAGERLGVFQRLSALAREERRILRRIDALERTLNMEQIA